ncbi:MAG: MFS transporter [Firmicutes bacterium]|nr:MFS transporter [Bacillota bacterium]
MEQTIQLQTPKKFDRKNFALLVFSQIISVFGIGVLRFALPLYILVESGNPALFGVVLSVPLITLLIATPIGGVMADRVKKHRLIFWLDLITTAIVVTFMLLHGLFTALPVVMVVLLLLHAIQGLFSPLVDASVPMLAPQEKLPVANSVVVVIHTLSGIAAPAIAALLFDNFGLFPILIVGAVAFAISTIIDLFLRIPYQKQVAEKSVLKTVGSDMSKALKFTFREKPIIAKTGFLIFAFAFSITALFVVGFPVLITQHLGLDVGLVGISQSISMVGGLIGSIIAGALGTRLKLGQVWLLMVNVGVAIITIAIIFMFDLSSTLTFIVMTLAMAAAMLGMQMFVIRVWSFVQSQIPTDQLGKVMALILTLPILAGGLGQLLFGFLFAELADMVWVVILGSAVITILMSFWTGYIFRKSTTLETAIADKQETEQDIGVQQ